MSIERSAGILLPISSLPSPYGIGTLGKEAYAFVDFLVRAKQTYWQILPVGHTSYGDSPYQAFSSFAGNPYFIDLDILVAEGLLNPEDLETIWQGPTNQVDYGYLYYYRYNLLYKAYQAGKEKEQEAFRTFYRENDFWLEDYALFMALKQKFDGKSWQEWPDQDIRLRKPAALEKYRAELADQVQFYEFIQYLFSRQFTALKEYANQRGIRLIGDLPIYISLDSSEVWADSDQFKLDKNTRVPKEVAGVPPDYFSEEGQLWGNPIYDWDYMKKDGYGWWLRRLRGVAKYFDVIRIDHFIGFERYWSVPSEAASAKFGHYNPGPSKHFIDAVKANLSDVDFIAEDLGVLTDECVELLRYFGYPGMRVLEFSMSPDGTSYHNPHNHITNCACYTATHDNEPVLGWVKHAPSWDLDYARRYYGLNHEEGYNWGFIRAGMTSVANLFVCPIQDYLGLDDAATINRPGTLGNWTWRLIPGQLKDELADKIALMTYGCARGK